ncbi:hypothetical protein ACQ86F_31840 [Streptomyces venezuelae ATCC 10712]
MTTTAQSGAAQAPGAGRPPRRISMPSVLLAAIRDEQGEWTVGRAKPLYRRILGTHTYRATIRRHLALLEALGYLTRHGDGTPHRCYTYRTEGQPR